MNAQDGARVRLYAVRTGPSKRELCLRVHRTGDVPWCYLTPAQAVRLAATLQRWAWKQRRKHAR